MVIERLLTALSPMTIHQSKPQWSGATKTPWKISDLKDQQLLQAKMARKKMSWSRGPPKNNARAIFLTDLNQWKKTFRKSLCQLVDHTVHKKCTMTKTDAHRQQTNFAHMARSFAGKMDEEMLCASQAVIDHHFDCHGCCGNWCNRKRAKDKDNNKKKCCRCKMTKSFALNCRSGMPGSPHSKCPKRSAMAWTH